MSFIDQPGFSDDVRSVLLDLLNLPPQFMDYTVQYNAVNPLPIPISQITGFSQFTSQVSPTIATQESTTSASYTDLATVGPKLSELPNGKYLVLFGAIVNNSTGGTASMAVQVNSAAVNDADHAYSDLAGSNISVMRAVPYTLASGDNNTLTAKYRADGTHSSFWESRWLVALKYANN